MHTVLPRRSKLEWTCPGLEPYGRIGPVKLEGKDCMRSATVAVQRKTSLAAVEGRRRWDRVSKARKNRAITNSGKTVLIAWENFTQNDVAAKSKQEGLFAVIEGSVALASGVAAGAAPVDASSV